MQLFLLFVLVVLLVIIGSLSYLNNPKAKSNHYFAEFLFYSAVWVVVNYYSNILVDLNTVLILNRLIFTSTTLLFRALFLFSKAYPNTKLIIKKRNKVLLDISTITISFVSLSPLIVEDVYLEANHSNIIFGDGIWLYFLFFIILFLSFISIIYRKYIISIGLERVKIQYLFIGLFLSSFFASITNLVLPVFFSEYSLTNLGPFSLLIFVLFAFIAIIKHRLLGIKFVIGNAVLSILQVITVFILMIFFTYLSNNYLNKLSPISEFFIQIIFVFVSLQILYQGKEIFETFVSNIFKYETLSYEAVKNTITQFLSTNVDIEEITEETTKILKEVLDSSGIYFQVLDLNKYQKIYEYSWDILLEDDFEINNVVNNYLKSSMKDQIIVKQELQYSHEDDSDKRLQKILFFMNKTGIEVFLASHLNQNKYLVILLNEKTTRQAYSVQEFDLLIYLKNLLSAAYSRAILYKEVKDFTNVLQHRVDDATSELKEKMQLLEEARQRERDMMDIMGHELRTPLSIIKIKQSLLRGKAQSEPQNFTAEDFLKLDSIITEALSREIDLLETMLSSTKVDAGRMELTFDEIPVDKIVQDSLLGHKQLAVEKGLLLKAEEYDKTLKVYADKLRLAEVLDNFVSNAIKYTLNGSIIIKVTEESNMVRFSVVDTGIGIPKKAMKRLGEKFYRVSQYTNGNHAHVDVVRPGGTGLGLYVAFALVKLMGGEVDIKSKFNEGSTFSFTVPKYTGQDTYKESKQSNNVFERLGLNKS